MNEWYELASEW